MDSDWYHHRNGQAHGPLTLEDLCDELGRLQDWREEVVWHQSLERWSYAGTIFQLRLIPSLQAARTPGSASLAASVSASDTEDEQWLRTPMGKVSAVVGLAVFGAFSAVLWRWLV